MSGQRIATAIAIGALLISSMPVGLSGTVIDTQVSSPAVSQAAENLYGAEEVTVHPGNDSAFNEAFPDLDLYYVFEEDRVPAVTHAMAYGSGAGPNGTDLTDGFNDLIDDAITSSDGALELAEAFAQVGNAELDIDRQVVESEDSDWLGVSVQDPSVVSTITGWEVELTTWSAENGILADWILTFGLVSIVETDMDIDGVGIGPFEADLYAANIDADMEFYNTWGSGHELEGWVTRDGTYQEMTVYEEAPSEGLPCPTMVDQAAQEIKAVNFDETEWRACDLGGGDAPSQAALDAAWALVDSGVPVYDEVVEEAPVDQMPSGIWCGGEDNPDPTTWGVHTKDSDCILRVAMLNTTSLACWVCVEGSNETNLYISPLFKDHLNAIGYYTNTTKHNLSEVAHAVMANAYTRHVMFLETAWTPAIPAFQDGFARLGQLLLNPDAEDDPTSLFVGDSSENLLPTDLDGAADFQNTPGASLCQVDPSSLNHTRPSQHADSYVLYWGWLHEQSGFEMIKHVWTAMDANSQEFCDPGTANATMADALGSCDLDSGCEIPSSWDDHAEHYGDTWVNSLTGFSMDMYARDFAWEIGGQTWDVGQHLPEVSRDQGIGDEVALAMSAYSIQFVEELEPGNASKASCTNLDNQGNEDHVTNWTATLILHLPDGSMTTDRIPCDGSVTDLPDHDLASMSVVRAAHETTFGNVAVLFQPAT